MIRIEQKNIKNKGFYYLSERFNTGNGFKKIQVYIGKNVPKKMPQLFNELKQKETVLLREHFKPLSDQEDYINKLLLKFEITSLDWKYFLAQSSKKNIEKIFFDFAISFIFESNSIEGSRLTRDEVHSIIKNKKIKKDITRDEIKEVLNSIQAFQFIRSGDFILNQKNIKKLYGIITDGLPGYEKGFKKKSNSVNNTNTTDPQNVKKELQSLILWYKKNKKQGNAFMKILIFHNRFEYIHPFLDGNGRTGRMILIWMLLQNGYGPILLKEKNKKQYFTALEHGDNGRYRKLIKYMIESYHKTISDIIKDN